MSIAGQKIESPPRLVDSDDPYDRYIQDQLVKTSFQVKVADLSSSLMVLLTGLLAAILVLALIDHWIMPLGRAGRWLALITVFLSGVVYIARVAVPLIFGRINPVYAARVIESAEPSLQNSLINFLFFRSDRAGLRTGMYRAMEQQAAANLSHVNPETAVDYSRLIRIGYVLIAVLVLCAGYTIFSPKSLFATAARVGAPWADIAKPTRVRIEDVTPADSNVFYGETIHVSARCIDVYDDEPVVLYYSTVDGQRERQPVTMVRSTGLTFVAQVPPEGGIEQDLLYWIEAGDAVTPLYRLTVEPAPTILVQAVDYDYPAYTGRSRKTVEDQADIRALEGTLVTVRARASHPIQSAVIEFDPWGESAGIEAREAAENSAVDSMEVDGQDASYTFPLELGPGRTEPKHRLYQVRFTTEDGETSQNPVQHRIEVTRDLPPEIEILTPERDRVEIPEDGLQRIEIRSLDPDFGLTRVRLRAVAGGVPLVDELLFEDLQGVGGQTIVQFDFQPRRLGLAAGEQAVFWAIAEDNRCSPIDGALDSNVEKTRDYRIVVLPAVNAEPPPSEPEQDLAAQDGADDSTTRLPEPAHPEPAGGEAGGEEDSGGGGEQGDETAGEEGSSDSQASSGAAGESAADDGSSEDSGADGSSGDSGGDSSSGGAGQQGTGDSQSSGMDGPSSGDDTQGGGDGSAGSDASGGGGGESGGEGGESSAAGSEPGGTGAPEYGTIREEPLHDGEAFEQIMEHIKLQDQPSPGESTGQSPSGEEPTGESSDTSAGDSSTNSTGGDTSQSSSSNDTTSGADQSTGAESDGGSGQEGDTGQTPRTGENGPQGANPDSASSSEGQEGGQGASGSEGREEDRAGAEEGPGQADAAGDDRGEQPKQGDSSSGESGSKPKQGGEGESDSSGAGQEDPKSDDKSSSNSADQNQPKGGGQKEGKPKQGGGQNSSEQSQSQSQSKKSSQSQGESSGDRSGGGGQGAGQNANQSGGDSAGSNSPSDSGAGASSESGGGDSASRPGGDQMAEDPTNTPGSQKGAGSSTMPAPGMGGSGAKGGGTENEGPTDRTAGTPSPSSFDQRGEGVPFGGGQPSAADLSGFDLTGQVPPGEQANLDYTRKATDLVLEYLRDQQGSPDSELLDKLGWTDEQLRAFLQRWESLKRSASEDPAKVRELDEALRTLGLRPRQSGSRSIDAQTDRLEGVRNVGTTSRPPASYLEKYNAFRRSTNRIGSP